MNNKQIAHLWANKSRESANGSHFYFEGDTIFSYGSHFPIARHYKGVVLFTSRSYSNSTARHISIARSACSHLKMFTVANPLVKPCRADVKNYSDSIKYLSAAASRSKDPQWKLRSVEQEINEANEFCQHFGFKTRFQMPDKKTLAELKERSKLAAQKKAKQTALRNLRIEKENAESIHAWIDGKLNSLGYNIQKVYLRANVKPFASEMQTSKGAVVPLAEAKKAFGFVMAKRTSGWHRNGEQFSVGEFQLDAVNNQGVIAGCHCIEWNEIERFAKLQGWL